jgi:aminoglycoside phosphotransferase (APT) family kinase protein
LIDTQRALEFAAYRSFHRTDVPVPEAIALVEDENVLGRPFFIMERIDHGVPARPFQRDPYGEHREPPWSRRRLRRNVGDASLITGNV